MHLPSPKWPTTRRRLLNELLHELVQCLPMSITPFERRIQLRVAFKNMALGVYIASAINKAEVVAPLKEWLIEHRKNPYPTNAEKTMLAISTKTTVTQVSIWFANARRLLKKDDTVSAEQAQR